MAGEHGAERTGVPEDLRSVSCLDDAALAALVEVGCRVDRYFGARQDIEWAFAPDGELHVLQSRPVTALPRHEPEPAPGSAIDLVMGAFGVGKRSLMPLDDDDVREILRLIDESELDELRVESEGLLAARRSRRRDRGEARARSRRADGRRTDGVVTIESPMLGTFYRAEAPGAAPFVDVGTPVDAGSTVCLIEVMKMMSSIAAGVAGTIVEVCAENARAGRARTAAVPGEAVSRTIQIVDTTTRDGNQSLWSATGLTAHDILSIAPTIERVGFHALDFTSSTHMGVSVRFHREDPWELHAPAARGYADDAAQLHHHRHALHHVAALRRGCDAARVSLCRAQRHPPLPDRRALELAAGAPCASRGWRGRRVSRRSSSG